MEVATQRGWVTQRKNTCTLCLSENLQLPFFIENPGSIPAKNSESTKEGREKLSRFRLLAEQKLCKQWSTAAELGSVVSRSLIQLIRTTPTVGWIRADELPTKEATVELLRLRKRVDELESELESVRTTAPKGTEDLAGGDELVILRYSYKSSGDDIFETKTWKGSFKTTWDRLFSTVAPLMINEESDFRLRQALDRFVKTENIESLSEKKEFKRQALKDFSLAEEDFQTVKIQLRALGLIEKSKKARSVHDSNTYWTLTPYGDSMMTRLRAVKTILDGQKAKAG